MRRATLVATASVIAVLGTGGALTTIGPWYDKLKKPSWQPPGWAFGPAWTVIGGLTAWAAVIAWTPIRSRSERRKLVGLFVVNGILNILWSLLFFNRRRPDWALVEVVALWLSIAALIADIRTRTPRAAWLLTPYLAWVSFAAVLNLTIVRLNPHTSRSEPA